MGHDWLYNEKKFDKELVGKNIGFVYIIENIESGKKYVGKKLFTSAKRIQRKKKTKRIRVESDWECYFGSSEDLLADVARLGKDKFKRTILHICKTKTECTYLELREQIDRRVLESDDFYNAWIFVRVRKKQLKF